MLVFVDEQHSVAISALISVLLYRRLGIHVMHHRDIMWKTDVIHKTGSTSNIATVRAELNHGHRQHAQKFGQSSAEWFSSYASGQTDRHTHHITWHPPRMQRQRFNRSTTRLTARQLNRCEGGQCQLETRLSLRVVICVNSLTLLQAHHYNYSVSL